MFRFSQIWRSPASVCAGRDVWAVLVLKGALLLAIYLLFFGPAQRSPSDAAATAHALIGTSTSKDAP